MIKVTVSEYTVHSEEKTRDGEYLGVLYIDNGHFMFGAAHDSYTAGELISIGIKLNELNREIDGITKEE